MSKPIEEILAPKPVARPRIYAYSIGDAARIALLASVLEVESMQGELP
jgi:hypothetical protein